MPVLPNPRHEIFAQAIAAGKPDVEAYAEAGYSPKAPNASRLIKNDNVRARVAELQERAAKRAEITVESLTTMYAQAMAFAREMGQAAAVVSAVTGIAKLHGMVIDKKEVGRPGEFAKMTDDELDRYIEERTAGPRAGREGAGRQENPPVLQ